MSIIEKINSIDVESILSSLQIKYQKKGYTLSLYDKGELTSGWKCDSIKGIFSDFSEKGRASGDRLEFVCRYLNCDKRKGILWFENTFNIKGEQTSFKNNNPIKDKFELLTNINSKQIEYLNSRAINYELVKEFIRDYKGNIALPIRSLDSTIKSIQSRNISEGGSRYYVEANTDSDGLFIEQLDYNKKALIVVEGFTDFLSLRQYTTNVVGLINAKNETQIDYIKELSNKFEIYFIPDNDEAGLVTVQKFKDKGIRFNHFRLETYGVKDTNEALVNYGIGSEILTIIFSESEKPISNLRSALLKAKEYKALYKENEGRLGFQTGQPLLDKYMDGFIRGKIYLIIGYSNQGKTRFAYSFIKNMTERKKRIAFYSLEVDTGMLYMELIGAIYGKTKKEVLEDLDNGAEYLSDIEEYIEVFDDVRKLEDIESHIKKNNYDVAFIDFVQNIEEKGDEYAKTTEIAIRLQKLAILTGTTLINLSQVNNESRFAEGVNIQPKGSGALFASSDVILSLWGRDGNKFLTIAKNKYGQAGVNFILNTDYSRSIFNIAEDFGGEASTKTAGFTRK